MNDCLKAFTAELERDAPRVERLALWIGGVMEPRLHIEPYLAQIDVLAGEASRRLDLALRGQALAEALIAHLGQEMGFAGDLLDYYNPANSYLHQVLERRMGLPITLSVLYMAIAARLGIHLEGVGFPGHFMLRHRDREGDWLLDPFHRAVVAAQDAPAYLARLFGQPIPLATMTDHYVVTTRALILRMLNNLRNVYVANRVFPQALRVLEYMVVVEPRDPELWRDRGLLFMQNGRYLAAENDLRRYFVRRNRLHLFTDGLEIGVLERLGGVWEGNAAPTEEEQQVLAVLSHIRDEIERVN